jgi:prepilin-type N-terminal cleavage/methylation domain-containing protein
MRQVKQGFTLIELLIVVAIIAILALIAVPNFLEAQTRAKVARAKNDLRTLAVGSEAYRVDNTTGPFLPFYGQPPRWGIVNGHNWPVEYGIWFILTTPIAYLSSVPHDVFVRRYNEQWGIWQDYYRVWNLENHVSNGGATPWGYPSTVNLDRHGADVLMASCGPDRVEDVSDGVQPGNFSATGGIIPYDPTNGTMSWGDIYYALGVGIEGVYQKAQP